MPGEDTGDEAATQAHPWWHPTGRALAAAILGVAALGVLAWVAPPSDVIDEIGNMNPLWVLGAIVLELGSCLSYVIVFRRFFPEAPRAAGRHFAWIAMGAGAVLPGGNISSAAARKACADCAGRDCDMKGNSSSLFQPASKGMCICSPRRKRRAGTSGIT